MCQWYRFCDFIGSLLSPTYLSLTYYALSLSDDFNSEITGCAQHVRCPGSNYQVCGCLGFEGEAYHRVLLNNNTKDFETGSYQLLSLVKPWMPFVCRYERVLWWSLQTWNIWKQYLQAKRRYTRLLWFMEWVFFFVSFMSGAIKIIWYLTLLAQGKTLQILVIFFA